jgi:starch-binding outer membrane protein, SusD/RagB family
MNMKLKSARNARASFRSRSLALLVALPVLASSACDSLLQVDLPGNAPEESLNNPAMARVLVNSAIGRFECAYSSYVITTGVLGNEFINSSTWLVLNGWGWKGVEVYSIAGSCPENRNAQDIGAYSPLQQARYMAEDGARRIEGFPEAEITGNKTEMLAQLYAYAGYATQLLGEGFCEMAIDLSPLMTRQQVFAQAEQRFTTAIGHAQAVSNTTLEMLATVGRARARLNKGDLVGAAADAEKVVSNNFVYYAEMSTVNGIRENRVFNLNRRNPYLSVDSTAYMGLQVGGVPDPRVRVVRGTAATTGAPLIGHDGRTAHFWEMKYNDAGADIPLASWFEAQLILAEARPAEAEAAINRIRAKQNLPLLTPGGDPRTLVIEERRRQLFAEGHRLNDMLRFNIPFPTGANHKGQTWGPVTCMPLPTQEKLNNPNLR